MSTEYNPKTSFDALKKQARCNQDIADWFQINMYCLPNVPTHLVQHMVVYLDPTNCFVGLNFTDDEVEGQVSITYTAQEPAVPEGQITADKFGAMLGAKVRVAETKHTRQAVKGTFKLYLSPVEWPFVAAAAAWDILGDGDRKNGLFTEKTLDMWPKAFPNVTWDLIANIYAAGLAPTTLADFTDWVFDKAYPQPSTTTLPKDFTP